MNSAVGGELDFTLTLNGPYDPGDPTAGVYGSINVTVGTQSNPAMSTVGLDPFPSTPGTTNYGNQSNSVLSSSSVTDVSTWYVLLAAPDFPVSITIVSSLFGLPTDASPVLAYQFTPNATTTPLPAALPLFASGVGLMGWMARRRRRKLQTVEL